MGTSGVDELVVTFDVDRVIAREPIKSTEESYFSFKQYNVQRKFLKRNELAISSTARKDMGAASCIVASRPLCPVRRSSAQARSRSHGSLDYS